MALDVLWFVLSDNHISLVCHEVFTVDGSKQKICRQGSPDLHKERPK